MPRFNQTGPMGQGPMTGGGRGGCGTNRAGRGTVVPRAASWGLGLGVRRGFRGGSGARSGHRGMGFGAGQAAMPQVAAEDTSAAIEQLRMQTETMQRSLEELSRKITEMEKSA